MYGDSADELGAGAGQSLELAHSGQFCLLDRDSLLHGDGGMMDSGLTSTVGDIDGDR